nr:glycoside hydrolase family 73 protein [Ligilactobacillus ceti]
MNRQQAPNQAQINEPDAAVKKAFIEKIAPVAQQEQKDYQIFASIILAQAALESDWGRSELATKYNNLFGVKGTGVNSALMKTKEYINGQWIVVKANFRVYPSWSASVKDHTQLLVKGTDWDRAHYQTVVQAGNYQKAARALQQEGYATDPNYADKLINLIEKYDLNQYDY